MQNKREGRKEGERREGERKGERRKEVGGGTPLWDRFVTKQQNGDFIFTALFCCSRGFIPVA